MKFKDIFKSKKLLYFIGGLITLLLITFLFVFNPFKQKTFKAIDAISNNSFAVFILNDPTFIFKEENKSISEKTLSFPTIEQFFHGLKLCDSLFSLNEKTKNILPESRLFASIHGSKKSKVEALFVLELAEKNNSEKILETIQKETNNIFLEEKINKNTFYKFKENPFYIALKSNLIIGSKSLELIESSISALTSKTSISQDKKFLETLSKSSKESPLNILISSKLLFENSQHLFSQKTLPNLSFLNDFFSWGNIDTRFSEQTISFSGLLSIKDRAMSFMNIFDNPDTNSTKKILSVLPDNTAFALAFSFDNFKNFFSNYTEKIKDRYNQENELKALNEKAKTQSLENSFYENIGGILSVFSVKNDFYTCFTTANSEEIKNSIQLFAKENKWDSLTFRNAKIYEIPVENLSQSLFGPLFSESGKTFLAICEDFAIIGSSIEKLKNLLNDIFSGRTLATTSQQEVLFNNISSTWNIFTFINTSLSAQILKNEWLSNLEVINKISALEDEKLSYIIATNYSRLNDGIVMNGTLFIDKNVPKDNNSWITNIDADFQGEPKILFDKKDNLFWIAVSDVFNNVYLLNSEGKIQWKKKLDTRLNSDFKLLFEGNPKKRSIAFSTQNSSNILNFNGEDYKNFPVLIKGELLSKQLVTNYDNSNNYRFIFFSNNGILENYSIDGKKTTGWQNPKIENLQNCEVFFCPIGKKDYIILSCNDNSIYVFNRKGNKISHIKDVFYNKNLPPVYENKQKNSWFGFSKDGFLVNISPEGSKKNISKKAYSEINSFIKCGDDFVLISDGSMLLINNLGEELFSIKISDAKIDSYMLIKHNQKSYLIYLVKNNVNIIKIEENQEFQTIKQNVSAFDCVLHNEKLIFISVSGKTIFSEAIEL